MMKGRSSRSERLLPTIYLLSYNNTQVCAWTSPDIRAFWHCVFRNTEIIHEKANIYLIWVGIERVGQLNINILMLPSADIWKVCLLRPQMLLEVVAKTLKHHGISIEHECFEACSKRLFDISKFYLKVSPVLSSLLLCFCPTRASFSDHMLYFVTNYIRVRTLCHVSLFIPKKHLCFLACLLKSNQVFSLREWVGSISENSRRLQAEVKDFFCFSLNRF